MLELFELATERKHIRLNVGMFYLADTRLMVFIYLGWKAVIDVESL